MLKPQDIVILLKIISLIHRGKLNQSSQNQITQSELANLLFISPSEINSGIKRLILSNLLVKSIDMNSFNFLPIKGAVEECLLYGVKYFIPARVGVYTRGVVTGHAAPVFKDLIVFDEELVPVWPYAKGDKRGLTLEPLYRSVPQSVLCNPDEYFYEMLVLVDAIRSGKLREQKIAMKLLLERIYDE